MAKRQYYVYIMTNQRNTVLYTGVTNSLMQRVYQHKNKIIKGFTEKYNINKLIYYEVFGKIDDAIRREKQIKGGSRKKKLSLVENTNKTFQDLSEDWY